MTPANAIKDETTRELLVLILAASERRENMCFELFLDCEKCREDDVIGSVCE